jgi:hypothetical protein
MRNEINAILDAEERAANERSMWLQKLPRDVASMVRVALSSAYTAHCVMWHDRNGGLKKTDPSFSEALQVRNELCFKLETLLVGNDWKMFQDCMTVVQDLSHSDKDCSLCREVPYILADRRTWNLIAT